MDQGLLPRRYAKALYKYAVERDAAAQMYTAMDTLAGAYDANNTLQATIANPFVDNDRNRIQAMVEKHLQGGTAQYSYSTDPTLIGGFTVTIDSQRLDASVRNELQQLRQRLIQ